MIVPKNRLGKYKAFLKKWNLVENPFRSTPPDDPKLLAKIFYGRDQELDLAILMLYEGRNIMVRGAWGIGKTSFILNLLYQLEQEVAGQSGEMLILYLSSIPGDKPTDFYRAILLAIADSLKEIDPEAKDIVDTFLGYSIQRSKISTEGKVNFLAVSFSYKDESLTNRLTPNANADPYPLLIRLLEKVEQTYERLVIAIDDFDKKDPILVKTILEGSLDLFRNGKHRAFIVTGRAFTHLQEATLKALGIFSKEIKLNPMTQDDLRHIAINYLNSSRTTPSDDCEPFTNDIMSLITNYAQGFPRQLLTICEQVLNVAANKEYEEINSGTFKEIWLEAKDNYTLVLTPQLRHLLYIAQQTGGITEDIKDQDLDKLKVLTFVALLPILKEAEDLGVLILHEDEGGIKYVPSKLFRTISPNPDI